MFPVRVEFYDFTLIYLRNFCLTRASHHSLISPGRYSNWTLPRMCSWDNFDRKWTDDAQPDSSIQVLSHLSQLPINSIEGHWASGLQSMPSNYHIYFSVLPSAKTSDLFFPIDFNSAQSRRRFTIWPKDWNCRSAAEWCRHLVLKAQAIPTYQLVAPPCAMTLERRIFFLNISQGSPRLRFWLKFPDE